MSIVSYPSKKADKQEVHPIKDLLQCIMSSAYRRKKEASTKRGNLIAQAHNTEVKFSNKKVNEALREKLVERKMKILNVRKYPISRDTLIIIDAESGVKRRGPKLLLECSMRKLHNEIINSPYGGGLLGARLADTNDVIISDTMIRSLSPPQLRPLTYNHTIMCGCEICNNLKYFQESLNTWQRKQLKIIKDKADNSRGRKKMN